MSDPTPAPPRLEARVESLERLSLAMHARIAELGQDMQASFHQASDEMLQEARKSEQRYQDVKSELAAMEERLKAAGEASEQRILTAFQELLTLLKPE